MRWRSFITKPYKITKEYWFVGTTKPSFFFHVYPSHLSWSKCITSLTWCAMNGEPLPTEALSSILYSSLLHGDHLSDWCCWSITNPVLTFLKIETDIRDISGRTTYFFQSWPCSTFISCDRARCTSFFNGIKKCKKHFVTFHVWLLHRSVIFAPWPAPWFVWKPKPELYSSPG